MFFEKNKKYDVFNDEGDIICSLRFVKSIDRSHFFTKDKELKSGGDYTFIRDKTQEKETEKESEKVTEKESEKVTGQLEYYGQINDQYIFVSPWTNITTIKRGGTRKKRGGKKSLRTKKCRRGSRTS